MTSQDIMALHVFFKRICSTDGEVPICMGCTFNTKKGCCHYENPMNKENKK